MSEPDRHACVLAIGRRGILIEGASGSGKSLLAARLIEDAIARGRFAALIADDRVSLTVRADRLIARLPDSAPARLHGLIELHHAGIFSAPQARAAVIDVVVRLEERPALPRLPERLKTTINGIALPLYPLPARNSGINCLLLASLAEDGPFTPAPETMLQCSNP